MKKIILILFVFVILFSFSLQANAELIVRGTDSLGNRLIYDTDLDITWYDYTRSRDTWENQVAWADALWVNFGGNVYDDWRLPMVIDIGNDGCNKAYSRTDCGWNVNTSTGEMAHLWYDELANLSYFDTSGFELQAGWGLSDTGDFLNLQAHYYASGTESALDTSYAWFFGTSTGWQDLWYKEYAGYYAIAVRDGDVTDITNFPAVPVVANDYFPLDPGTVWQYLKNGQRTVSRRVLNKVVKVEGVKTRPVKFVEEDATEYYTSDSNGISLHRQYQANVYISGIGWVDVDTIFIPPIKLAESNAWIGQSLFSSGRAETVVRPTGDRFNFFYTADSTIEAQETITVPAGTFDTVRHHTTISVGGITQSSTRYLAEGIGVVKDVTTDPQGKTLSFEMLSFTSVSLLAPNGGEIIPSGGTYDITWKSTSDMTIFQLSYSLDNGVTWIPISGAENVTENHYLWTAPLPVRNEKSCRIKVIGYNDAHIKVKTDISDSPFTIEVVKVTSPDGSEVWTSGELHFITWITNGTIKPVASVKLFYSKNNGIKWLPITTITGGNPGSYARIVPPLTKAKINCRVKVVLKDSAGHSIGKDISDQVFMMLP